MKRKSYLTFFTFHFSVASVLLRVLCEMKLGITEKRLKKT